MAVQAISGVERLHGAIIVTWNALAEADTGAPYQPPQGYDLESIQFHGTAGGTNDKVEGSNLSDQSQFTDYTDSGSPSLARTPVAQALSFRPFADGGTGVALTPVALFRQRS